MTDTPHSTPTGIYSFIIFLVAATAATGALLQDSGAARRASRLELLHADVSRGIIEDGKPLKVLEGHVEARQDSLQLFCNRAVYDRDEDKITLFDDVKLIRGKDTLWANQITYHEKTKIAVSEGNVLVSRPGQRLRSDYLEYHYGTDQIRASGHLYLHDAPNRVSITGREGEYLPDEKYSYVEKNAHFWRVDSSSTDTLNIFSDKMDYYFGEPRRAVARDSVRIYQATLHATCDSAIYQLDEDIIYLEGQPHATQENSELFGKQMQLILHERQIDRIRVEGGAEAISVVDSATEKENRLEGREIVMYISNRKLREIRAISNARSRYYLKEKQENRGINVASADTIKAFFVNNELDSIAVIGGSQGIYYPEDYKGPILQE